ncbi:MAG: MBL fold metallo-hydrolase [Bryobacteraceae bacterium]|nr:MBL fold metallo-hydrolase [Bryobacteraceae bacterium]
MRFAAFLLVSAAAAQSLPRGYVDPAPVLRAASEAIGAGQLRCVTIAGAGYAGKLGQNVTQDTDWPKVPLTNYTRTISYDAKASIERFTRTPGESPRSWKYGAGWLGGTPLQQSGRQTFIVNGAYAWNTDGENGEPIPARPDDAEMWQLDIWMNPHGFLKAAMMPGANPKAIWRWEMVESGRDGATTGAIEKMTIVSITVMGKYRVNATINPQNIIQRIETKFPHPVLGDMNYEHEHSDWRELPGGIRFPATWHSHQGYDDERFKPTITSGHNAFGGEYGDIRVNVCPAIPSPPEVVRNAAPPATRVEPARLSDGVWLLGGGSHNSALVEFKDFLAVVEAPLDEERSLAVIEEAVKLAPGKPIRFLVNTHDHFDHIGGLRTYLHIGATIVTHKRNRVFYEDEILNYVPRLMRPDMVSLYQPTEIREGYTMETVAENYVISDGVRNLHISYVQPLAHVEGMLMAWLPKERIVIEADLFNPGMPTPEGSMKSFRQHVRRLGLEPASIAPIHGRAVPWADFLKALAPD